MEIFPEKFVEDYIYNLTKTSLEKSKPLWEVHIINLKTSEAEGVWVFRIHHSLGDGMSLMSLLLACTRQTANPEALPTLPTAKKKKKKNNQEHEKGRGGGHFITSFSQCFTGVWWLFQLLWNTFVDVFLFLATAFFLRGTQTPIRAPPGTENNPRRIIFRTLSLGDFKLVKNAMNSTINDVALGVTQGALSRYLNRRYGENKKDKGGSTGYKNNLPSKIRLRSNLLDLADMMEKNSEAKWGNWLGYVLIPFNIALKDDPLDYIREVRVTVERKKHSLEALCTFYISGLVVTLLGIKVRYNKYLYTWALRHH
ncbi:O-acyltransferase [Parasponia andersonii]|uniref:O-acyltransferase n=1 Tax=Parasponia andersonii TaxID=3476 RepID=A0A2P5BRB4_PARAD|nr:O-acyltransferase [Parasponia andersonii]